MHTTIHLNPTDSVNLLRYRGSEESARTAQLIHPGQRDSSSSSGDFKIRPSHWHWTKNKDRRRMDSSSRWLYKLQDSNGEKGGLKSIKNHQMTPLDWLNRPSNYLLLSRMYLHMQTRHPESHACFDWEASCRKKIIYVISLIFLPRTHTEIVALRNDDLDSFPSVNCSQFNQLHLNGNCVHLRWQ